MFTKRQRLHIDPYYSPPSDGFDPSSPLSSSPSTSFSFSPPTDMSSVASRTPTSAGPEWRLCIVLCLYDFDSADADHLPFRKNELLEIVKKEESGWWAALRDDRIGWVPSAFVTQLSDEAAAMLRDVEEELRIYEYDAERLYNSDPIANITHFFDPTPSPDSAQGHELGLVFGHGNHAQHEDASWVPIVEPGGKIPYMQLVSPPGLSVTDFPDDVAPLSGHGVSSHPRPLPLPDPLERGFSDSGSESSSDQATLVCSPALPCPPSPATPMPQPLRPKIAPLLINKPTPPTPPPPTLPSPLPSPYPRPAYPAISDSRASVPLQRTRSGSAPSVFAPANRNAKRRPIMVSNYSSLSTLSVYLDSPAPDAEAIQSPFSLPDAYDSISIEGTFSPLGRRADKVKQLTGDDDAQAFHNAKLAQANLPWYLQPSYSPDDIKLEYDGSVRAGTLLALVERLTVDPLKMTQETLYRHAFLTTFHTFTSADQLFDLLVERYEMDHPASLTSEQFNEWKEKKLRPVQKRVLTILSMWLEEHGMLQDDPQIAPRVRDFLSLILSPPSLALSAKLMLQTLDRTMSASSESPVSTIVTPSKRRKPARALKKELLRHDPADLAQQLTLFEYRLYTKIRPRECLTWAKSQVGDNVANLSAFCATHDKIAAWVTMSVLGNEGLGKRADMVDFWIKVAEKCRTLNNFSSTSAIVAALSSTVITRLHLTWAHVARGSHMEPLVRVTEPTNNFSAYRAACQAIDGPCIPFAGTFLTDLVHIQDRLKDCVSFPLVATQPEVTGPTPAAPSPPTSNGSPTGLPAMGSLLVNFVKRQRWYDAVYAIVRFQSKTYEITENTTTLGFIAEQLALAGMRDPALSWARSQELQQNEVAHADIRKGLEAAGF